MQLAAIAITLAACVPQGDRQPSTRASQPRHVIPEIGADLMAAPAAPRAAMPSNAQLARDFLDLTFALETGRDLTYFSRFEGPVSITLAPGAPSGAREELERLIARLRNEAGLSVTTAPGQANRITVAFVSERQLQSSVPNAACFVAPNVDGWDDFRRNRRGGSTDWTQVTTRRLASVFIPANAPQQEIRDCLHEELSQALGPLNDLYRLPYSVWNDDNFHTVLTRFDMLILRAYNAPELRSGMTEGAVAAQLPTVLARINPGGGPVFETYSSPTPRAYISAIEAALGAQSNPSRRLGSAQEALRIARAEGWHDTRAAFAWFALGRLAMRDDPQGAVQALSNARSVYAGIPGTAIHIAHVDVQLAAVALGTGRAEQALTLADRSLPAVQAAQNGALIATIQLIRAEALARLGQPEASRQARLDSANWARYGFGSDAAARARATEIALLAKAGAQVN
ncbi:DUF2927 domain-containing protein [Sedimentimonas flavescens]|uniref:DUF2927 domain-containing protein n=1 Tax=Sedimentimonas flavescens TaxID=2851012 RepID=UPI0021A57178|nr:DUF2927 domain-containing protein [Sedimentimonas flavescens]MCT2540638.1 DUF2927 domain-containing protein [Sedimentimonas flavescens]